MEIKAREERNQFMELERDLALSFRNTDLL
jgi:hypothetical protein